MTKLTIQPLRTLEMLNLAPSLPCFVCGNGTSFDAASCRYCQAPVAITRQTSDDNCRAHMLAVIGSPNSGKTVYLGMLADMLSRQNHSMQLVSRGALSVALQQTSISALSKCRFPPNTPDDPSQWNWMHCQIKGNAGSRSVELIVPDVSGQAMARELEPTSGCLALRSVMNKTPGAMLLIDAASLTAGDQEDEFFAMKAISSLCEIQSGQRLVWPYRPVAIVLTKGDLVEEAFEDPAEFLRQHAPGLWKLCEDRLEKFEVFTTSVVGAIAYQNVRHASLPVPLRIEPRGVIEPFQWLVQKIAVLSDRDKRSSWKRFFFRDRN